MIWHPNKNSVRMLAAWLTDSIENGGMFQLSSDTTVFSYLLPFPSNFVGVEIDTIVSFSTEQVYRIF